jgi:hypothetical protein
MMATDSLTVGFVREEKSAMVLGVTDHFRSTSSLGKGKGTSSSLTVNVRFMVDPASVMAGDGLIVAVKTGPTSFFGWIKTQRTTDTSIIATTTAAIFIHGFTPGFPEGAEVISGFSVSLAVALELLSSDMLSPKW